MRLRTPIQTLRYAKKGCLIEQWHTVYTPGVQALTTHNHGVQALTTHNHLPQNILPDQNGELTVDPRKLKWLTSEHTKRLDTKERKR